ncbi:MAG: heavy-metal-associated domain-containing protein [Burkholderiales bacterium]|nr:heavy-metal-associated domain-containing protein [Burkholderiales bacterium]
MLTFEVADMTCGHCASRITRAVQALDPAARVRVDLAHSRVEIEPSAADAQALAEAVREAGYTPVPVAAA